jgi:hypothetical protein
MAQCKANQWIHTLLPVLAATLAAMGDAPARTIEELSHRLKPSPSPTVASTQAVAVATPLFVMTAPSGGSGGPGVRLNKKAIIAARKNATP